MNKNMKQEKEIRGLSDNNIKLIVGLIFVCLLLFGSMELGLIFRIAYLIIIPIVAWLVLRYLGKRWDLGILENDRLNRAIFACIAGVLLVGAYLSYNSKYHTECTQTVQTRDGQECVGDYIAVKGSDKSGALIQIMLSGGALWWAVSKKRDEVKL